MLCTRILMPSWPRTARADGRTWIGDLAIVPRLAANLVPMKKGGQTRSLRGKLKRSGCNYRCALKLIDSATFLAHSGCLGLLWARKAQTVCPETMQGRNGRHVAIAVRYMLKQTPRTIS